MPGVKSTPRHIAIIMDGNGRWASENGYDSRIYGHEKGAGVLCDVTLEALAAGVEYITFFAFSSENWGRPSEEVRFILSDLLPRYLELKLDFMMENGIKFRAIGNLGSLPPRTRDTLARVEEATRGNDRITGTLALSYGGRQEIVEAAKAFARLALEAPESIETLDSETFSRYLYAPDIPEPDLLIRTSGEKRLSNFMLWQLSYAEILFTDTLWPDFSEKEFGEALEEFARRQRRFGSLEGDARVPEGPAEPSRGYGEECD